MYSLFQSVHSCLDTDSIYGIVKETISLFISVVKCVGSSKMFSIRPTNICMFQVSVPYFVYFCSDSKHLL